MVRLIELHRFAAPADAGASLPLQDGRPESLGFYLDRQRIHVGDLAALALNLFDAWRADREEGLDSVMLASTRDLVAELNRRARAHRLRSAPTAGPVVGLADGSRASVGDLIITRRNDRRLRSSAFDWVNNGDRWTVFTADRNGGLRVHRESGRTSNAVPVIRRTTTSLNRQRTLPHTAPPSTFDLSR